MTINWAIWKLIDLNSTQLDKQLLLFSTFKIVVVVVVLLFYVHGKHLRSCRDGQLT